MRQYQGNTQTSGQELQDPLLRGVIATPIKAMRVNWIKGPYDFFKLFSIPVKGALTFANNLYILKILGKGPLVWTLAGSAAMASIINRSRNQWLWDKNLFRKSSSEQAIKNHWSKLVCVTGNIGLQIVNNYSITVISNTVQFWDAARQLSPQSLPDNDMCLPWEWIGAIIPGIFIAIQFKANRIDKQRMQLEGMLKDIHDLHDAKQCGKLTVAFLVTFGTVVAFAMTSFFVLKTITTDFLNFILSKIDDNAIITDTQTLHDINLIIAIISITAGLFQSTCTAAIMFRLFKWDKKIKPHLGYFWKHHKLLFLFALLNNATYSAVNAFMTLLCTEHTLVNFMHPSNTTLLPANYSQINCTINPTETPHINNADIPSWIIVIAAMIALLQAVPMFLNNLLYNFLVNIPKAEAKDRDSIAARLGPKTEEATPQIPDVKITYRGRILTLSTQLDKTIFEAPWKTETDKKGKIRYLYHRQTLFGKQDAHHPQDPEKPAAVGKTTLRSQAAIH